VPLEGRGCLARCWAHWHCKNNGKNWVAWNVDACGLHIRLKFVHCLEIKFKHLHSALSADAASLRRCLCCLFKFFCFRNFFFYVLFSTEFSEG